jgi:hypothetical protein
VDSRRSSRTVSVLEILLGSPKATVVVSSVTLGNCGPSPYLPNIGEHAIVLQDRSGLVGIQKIDPRSEFAQTLGTMARSAQSTRGAHSASTVELSNNSVGRGRQLKSLRTETFDESKDMSSALMDVLTTSEASERTTRQLSALLQQVVKNPEQFACYLIEGGQDSLRFGMLYLIGSAKRAGAASDNARFANELLEHIATYLHSYPNYLLSTTRLFVDNQLAAVGQGIDLRALDFVTGVKTSDIKDEGMQRVLYFCKPLHS